MAQQQGELPIFSKETCSEEFLVSFCHSSHMTATCQACGREYYAPGDWDEGEFEKMEQDRQKNPDKFILLDDFARVLNFGGKQIVFECECNYATVIERLLLDNQSDILSYFDMVTGRELEESIQNRKEVNKVLQKANK